MRSVLRVRGAFPWLCLMLYCSQVQSASWVTITEIHYHPPEGDALEFLEILCREPPRVDMGDWTLEGEVDYVFPRGTVVMPGERIIVARSPRHFKEVYPSVARVLGPFSGKLDNKGGRVTLRNAAGGLVCEVPYERDGGWPTVPDGTGHTLSLKDPYFDTTRPGDWTSSPLRGGTPGADNGFSRNIQGTPIVKKGATWRFLRGKTPVPANWRDAAFDDSRWEAGASGIGYGDGDDATVISDMQGNYMSLYARHAFEVTNPGSLHRLVLRVDYDDGFILSLNGKEVAREQMGPTGTPAAHDAPSVGRHEAGVPAEYDLGPAARLLRQGRNVLAVEVHNDDLDSSDLTIIVELESRSSQRMGRSRDPLLNEVLVTPAEKSFVEIYNPNTSAYSLKDHFLSDDPLRPGKFRIPDVSVPPFGFAVLGRKQLGEEFRLAGAELTLVLTRPDGKRVLDALRVETGETPNESPDEDPAGGPGEGKRTKRTKPGPTVARGRYPDGSFDIAVLTRPTPARPNRQETPTDLVIHEIMYHPITEDNSDEYVEIYNRGTAEIELDGYRLRGGVRYDFKAGESLLARGYLVVAKDPEALASKYNLSRKAVAGPYRGSLSNRGETLTLFDPLSNVVDRVEYADRDPWPVWADGLGSSLELVHPDLDNSIAASWAASDDSSKARWKKVTYAKEHRVMGNRPGRVLPELQFMLLNEGECLVDDVHLGARKELVTDGSFRRGGADWRAMGTHERSRVEKDSSGKAFYRLVSDGRGDARSNYVTLSIAGGLQEGQRYRIAFRAKWQRGAQRLLTRTAGQGVAMSHRLQVPRQLGSPGKRNTIHSDDFAPAVGRPRQFPITPTDEQSVSVTSRISALGQVATATLMYRRTGTGNWLSVPLTDVGRANDGAAGDGLWGATIPQLPHGVVEFYVVARDTAGREGKYPRDAPTRTGLYGVGIIPNNRLPTYTLLVSESQWRELQNRPLLSNRLADGTLVYGDSRIFYNVGFRPRGSPFTRRRLQFNYNWRIAFGSENLDGRRTLTIDGQGGDGTRLNERLTFWIIDKLRAANSRQQYVYFRLQGLEGYEQGIYEDVEKVDGAYLENWIDENPRVQKAARELAAKRPTRSRSSRRKKQETETLNRGLLHKIDDYFEVFPGGNREHVGEAFLHFTSKDPEDYRWYYPLRANGNDESYEPLVELILLMDPKATPDSRFFNTVEERVDVDQWLRVLAARTIVNDWDTFGRDRGKNAFLYLSPADVRWRLIPWDADLSWSQGRVYAVLIATKFPSITRLLNHPPYKYRYYGYLAYIADQLFEPTYFRDVVGDLNQRSGARVDAFIDYATQRRSGILAAVRSEVSLLPLRVQKTGRVKGSGEPDEFVASGVAPLLAYEFLLDGRQGFTQIHGYNWVAKFPVGPDGRDALLQAVDLGGREVGRAMIKISSREGALPLPSEEKAPAPELVARVEPVPQVSAPIPEVQGDTPTEQVASAEPNAEIRFEERSGKSTADFRAPPLSLDELTGAGPGTQEDSRDADLVSRGVEEDPAWDAGERADLEGQEATEDSWDGTPPVSIRRDLSSGLRRSSEDDATTDVARRPSPFDDPVAEGVLSTSEVSEVEGKPIWIYLVGLFAVLGIAQGAVLLVAKRRRSERAPEAGSKVTRAKPAASPLAVSLKNLGSNNFTLAAAGLQHLWMEADSDVPALIEALDDKRPTPFLKVRRTRQGLQALPTNGPRNILVRHVAGIVLQLKLGKPPVERPTKAHWLAHWRRVRG